MSSARSEALCTAALGACLTASAAAHGQAPSSFPKLGEAAVAGYWENAPSRAFVAATFDAGLSQVREELAVGYGRPHWSWAGVVIAPRFSTGSGALYGGAVLALPFLEVRTGARFTTSFSRDLLVPRDAYTRNDTELQTGEHARYLGLEGALSGTIPAPGGEIRLLAELHRVGGVPAGRYFFDEALKVVVRPPWVFRARGAYVLQLGKGGFVSIGPLVEVVGAPGRDDATVFRVGPTASVKLSPRLDAIGTLAVTVQSRDSLGLLGADSGQLGLRFRWATGAAAPR